MGKSKSSAKTNQIITNNTVNQNYINTLNKSIMNSAVQTMVKNASSCSSAINQNNSCNMSGSKINGNFDFSGNQNNVANVDFSCIQASKTSADMKSQMIANMTSQMRALNGTDSAILLNNSTQSLNNSGFGSTGGSSSATSKTNSINNITNDTVQKIENIFEHNLSNNFSSDTVNECIGKTSQSNSLDLSNINIGGNANVQCFQANSLKQVQECKQLSDAISKTTQQTFQELGLKTDITNQTSSFTDSNVSSASENISSGPIQDLSNGIGDIIGSIFGLSSFAFLGPIIGPICLLCSCVLCLLFIFFISKSVLQTNDFNNLDTLNSDIVSSSFHNQKVSNPYF